MKPKILALAFAAMSLSACAQVDYRQCDNLYPPQNDNGCVSRFDDVVDEVSTVRNVLVRNKEVVNYYHDNVVVENHYNISRRPIGYARYFPRRYGYCPTRYVTIVPRENIYYVPTRTDRNSQYISVGAKCDNKWFFFFDLNSSFLKNKEEIGHLIDYAKSNPYSVFYIDAYADVETGDYNTNIQISQMRANTIINILLGEGISNKRLFVQYHGSVTQPYRTNNLNRCVTVSTTSK
jgi:hypothetical protein